MKLGISKAGYRRLKRGFDGDYDIKSEDDLLDELWGVVDEFIDDNAVSLSEFAAKYGYSLTPQDIVAAEKNNDFEAFTTLVVEDTANGMDLNVNTLTIRLLSDLDDLLAKDLDGFASAFPDEDDEDLEWELTQSLQPSLEDLISQTQEVYNSFWE